VPEAVTLAPLVAVKVSPPGRVPLTIDQLYGATPPVAVQVAVYMVPTSAGPVVGEQEMPSGCGTAIAPV
jgi:hypothetical protein